MTREDTVVVAGYALRDGLPINFYRNGILVQSASIAGVPYGDTRLFTVRNGTLYVLVNGGLWRLSSLLTSERLTDVGGVSASPVVHPKSGSFVAPLTGARVLFGRGEGAANIVSFPSVDGKVVGSPYEDGRILVSYIRTRESRSNYGVLSPATGWVWRRDLSWVPDEMRTAVRFDNESAVVYRRQRTLTIFAHRPNGVLKWTRSLAPLYGIASVQETGFAQDGSLVMLLRGTDNRQRYLRLDGAGNLRFDLLLAGNSDWSLDEFGRVRQEVKLLEDNPKRWEFSVQAVDWTGVALGTVLQGVISDDVDADLWFRGTSLGFLAYSAFPMSAASLDIYSDRDDLLHLATSVNAIRLGTRLRLTASVGTPVLSTHRMRLVLPARPPVKVIGTAERVLTRGQTQMTWIVEGLRVARTTQVPLVVEGERRVRRTVNIQVQP